MLGVAPSGRLTRGVHRPQPVRFAQPVVELHASTYCSIAVTASGKVFSWGDSDGGALGHAVRRCHVPTQLPALGALRVMHASCCYTNGAASTADGRVFVWGGQRWEGGISREAQGGMPTEVQWAGVPACYRCESVSLAHRHGFLIFRLTAGEPRSAVPVEAKR